MSDAAAEDAFRRAVAADGSLQRLARALTLAEGASLHLLEVETPRTMRAALLALREALGERALEVVSRPFEELRTREDVVAEVLATLTVVREDGAPLVLDASTAMREERATWTWLFHRWNEGRERWLGTRRAPVMLALPPWLARLLAEEAPDLWSVRGPGARVTVGPPLAIPLLDREPIPGRRFDVDRRRSLASLEFSVVRAREASERSADEESRVLLAEALLTLGDRQRAREDLAAAIACFADAMQVCEGEWAGPSATRIWIVASTASIGIADAALLIGRTEEAAEEVVRGEALCTAKFVSAGLVAWTECLLAVLRVRVLAVRGYYDAAGAAVEQAYEVRRRATSTLTDSVADAIEADAEEGAASDEDAAEETDAPIAAAPTKRASKQAAAPPTPSAARAASPARA